MNLGKLGRAGLVVAALAMAAMGALELGRGEALPGLHAYPDGAPESFIRASGAWLALSAASLVFASRIGAWANAASWAVALLFVLIGPVHAATDALPWVQAAETLVFALFALSITGEGQLLQLALRLAFGAMLLLFGAIHLTNAEMIASLIPSWMPAPSLWPFVTGGVQVVAGLACLAGQGVRYAAGGVALMYALWLPFVHAARIVNAPVSLFEWTFALTALALAGVALTIAVRGR